MPSDPSYLILCDERDRVGPRALRALQAGLSHGIELLTPRDLERAAYARIGRSQNRISSEIVLRDGRILSQQRIAGLWNRLSRWPANLAGRESGAPAALCAWIRGIRGTLLGYPSLSHPQSSQTWSRLHWAMAAHRAGLTSPCVRRQVGLHLNSLASAPDPGDRFSLLVAGDRLLCSTSGARELPQSTRDACLRLGRAVGSGLLEIRLMPSGDHGWEFADANQCPDPFSHGPAGIQSLIDLWLSPSAFDQAEGELEEVR